MTRLNRDWSNGNDHQQANSGHSNTNSLDNVKSKIKIIEVEWRFKYILRIRSKLSVNNVYTCYV